MHLKGLDLHCLPAPDNTTDAPACDRDGIAFFQGFRDTMLGTMSLTGVFHAKRNGLYADACIHHSIALFGDFWNNPVYSIGGVTASRAVEAWLRDDVGPHVHIDGQWPDNMHCVKAFET